MKMFKKHPSQYYAIENRILDYLKKGNEIKCDISQVFSDSNGFFFDYKTRNFYLPSLQLSFSYRKEFSVRNNCIFYKTYECRYKNKHVQFYIENNCDQYPNDNYPKKLFKFLEKKYKKQSCPHVFFYY